MTLHTRVRVTAPLGDVTLDVLWDKVLADLVAVSDPTAPHESRSHGEHGRGTVLGQGLAGILEAEVGPDGAELPRDDHPEWADPEEDYDGLDHDPHAWAEVGWDTAYGYDDEHGGCGTLHARLIVSLGAWLDERGLPWSWYNEFRGDWHEGGAELETLLDGGRAATTWFASIAPALEARLGTEGTR
jgi:hypothetical protein